LGDELMNNEFSGFLLVRKDMRYLKVGILKQGFFRKERGK
jgi:hypothetical protein